MSHFATDPEDNAPEKLRAELPFLHQECSNPSSAELQTLKPHSSALRLSSSVVEVDETESITFHVPVKKTIPKLCKKIAQVHEESDNKIEFKCATLLKMTSLPEMKSQKAQRKFSTENTSSKHLMILSEISNRSFDIKPFTVPIYEEDTIFDFLRRIWNSKETEPYYDKSDELFFLKVLLQQNCFVLLNYISFCQTMKSSNQKSVVQEIDSVINALCDIPQDVFMRLLEDESISITTIPWNCGIDSSSNERFSTMKQITPIELVVRMCAEKSINEYDINSDIAECFCKNICFLRFFDFYAMKTMNELIQTAIIPFFEELVKTQENAQKPIQTAFELILRTFGSVDKAINKLCQNINSNFSRIHQSFKRLLGNLISCLGDKLAKEGVKDSRKQSAYVIYSLFISRLLVVYPALLLLHGDLSSAYSDSFLGFSSTFTKSKMAALASKQAEMANGKEQEFSSKDEVDEDFSSLVSSSTRLLDPAILLSQETYPRLNPSFGVSAEKILNEECILYPEYIIDQLEVKSIIASTLADSNAIDESGVSISDDVSLETIENQSLSNAEENHSNTSLQKVNLVTSFPFQAGKAATFFQNITFSRKENYQIYYAGILLAKIILGFFDDGKVDKNILFFAEDDIGKERKKEKELRNSKKKFGETATSSPISSKPYFDISAMVTTTFQPFTVFTAPIAKRCEEPNFNHEKSSSLEFMNMYRMQLDFSNHQKELLKFLIKAGYRNGMVLESIASFFRQVIQTPISPSFSYLVKIKDTDCYFDSLLVNLSISTNGEQRTMNEQLARPLGCAPLFCAFKKDRRILSLEITSRSDSKLERKIYSEAMKIFSSHPQLIEIMCKLKQGSSGNYSGPVVDNVGFFDPLNPLLLKDPEMLDFIRELYIIAKPTEKKWPVSISRITHRHLNFAFKTPKVDAGTVKLLSDGNVQFTVEVLTLSGSKMSLLCDDNTKTGDILREVARRENGTAATSTSMILMVVPTKKFILEDIMLGYVLEIRKLLRNGDPVILKAELRDKVVIESYFALEPPSEAPQQKFALSTPVHVHSAVSMEELIKISSALYSSDCSDQLSFSESKKCLFSTELSKLMFAFYVGAVGPFQPVDDKKEQYFVVLQASIIFGTQQIGKAVYSHPTPLLTGEQFAKLEGAKVDLNAQYAIFSEWLFFNVSIADIPKEAKLLVKVHLLKQHGHFSEFKLNKLFHPLSSHERLKIFTTLLRDRLHGSSAKPRAGTNRFEDAASTPKLSVKKRSSKVTMTLNISSLAKQERKGTKDDSDVESDDESVKWSAEETKSIYSTLVGKVVSSPQFKNKQYSDDFFSVVPVSKLQFYGCTLQKLYSRRGMMLRPSRVTVVKGDVNLMFGFDATPKPDDCTLEIAFPSGYEIQQNEDTEMIPAVVVQPAPPSEEEKQIILKVYKKSIKELDPESANLIWRHRLWIIKELQLVGLLSVIRVTPWNKLQARRELHHSILPNVTFSSSDSLVELLSGQYPDTAVRNMAVRWLNKLTYDDVEDYIPQLVQGLLVEPFACSKLALFLLQKAIWNRPQIGHKFFWLLFSDLSNSVAFPTCFALLRAYLRGCGEHRRIIGTHCSLIKDLLAITSRGAYKTTREIFEKELGTLNICSPYRVPYDPSIVSTGLSIPGCKVIDSFRFPIKLAFTTEEELKFELIFKTNDDLRQDMLALQAFSIMDKIWCNAGLDLCMTRYAVMALGSNYGIIEIVQNCETMAYIQKLYGSSTLSAAFNEKCLKQWLQEQNPDETEFKAAVNNFVRSCAFYCVATYILGVGDRHNDNILLTKSGQMFHIDFGKILGNVQRWKGFSRESAPFVLTPEYAYVMGGKGAPDFEKFTELCCDAYCLLRKESNLLLTLFQMISYSGLADLVNTNSNEGLNYLTKALDMKTESEEVARANFKKLIYKSLENTKTRINNAIHIYAHPQK